METIILDHLEQNIVANGRILYVALMGSRAYGTHTPESDYDYRGIFIPNIEYILKTKDVKHVSDDKQDVQIYDLVKFIGLAKSCNPNIIEMLYVKDENVYYVHPLFKKIRDNRDLFLSKIAKDSFLGYAFQQLKRIKNHKKWIDQPAQDFTRAEFGLPPQPLLANEKLNALMSVGKKGLEELKIDKSILDYIDNECQFRQKKLEHKQYKTWVSNRNRSRAELEYKYGFDTKHATHLFRLLKMSKYIATKQQVLVEIPEVETLRAIQSGKYNYEELIHMAECEMNEVRDAFEKSFLPPTPNYAKINHLLLEILTEYFDIRNTKAVEDKLLNQERREDGYREGQEIFIVFEDPDNEECLHYYEIPNEDPDDKHIKATSPVYKLVEMMAKKLKVPSLIFRYKYVNGRLVEGKYVNSIR